MTTTAQTDPQADRLAEELEEIVDALRASLPRRDEIIRLLKKRGWSTRKISPHAGMTHQNVALIVQKPNRPKR